MSERETEPLIQRPEGSKGKRGNKWNHKKYAGILIVLSLISVTLWHLMPSGLTGSNSTIPNFLDSIKLRIYTNNIRLNGNSLFPHERPWSKRRGLITSSIDFHTDPGSANVVCLQEVLHDQLQDILYALNDEGLVEEWGYYGVGRTDGLTRGEYSPIFFKHEDWIVLDNKTYWLSETPDVPSKGWDAVLERIVTMVTVQSRVNPRIKLNFFNTHFDHIGKEARRQSSLLIIDRMKNHNDYPSFLCGDFNTQPTDEPYHILKKHGFKDSRTLIDSLHSYGHNFTYTGFDHNHEDTTIIDYIWAPYFAKNGHVEAIKQLGQSMDDFKVSEEDIEDEDINFFKLTLHEAYSIAIKSYGVLHSHFSYYMSDHRPVVADYVVNKDLW